MRGRGQSLLVCPKRPNLYMGRTLYRRWRPPGCCFGASSWVLALALWPEKDWETERLEWTDKKCVEGLAVGHVASSSCGLVRRSSDYVVAPICVVNMRIT